MLSSAHFKYITLVIKDFSAIILLNFIMLPVICQANEWRGNGREGIYKESGLLMEWPENGPPLLMEIIGVGAGFSSVTVTDKSIYVTGKKGSSDVLMAFNHNGEKKWETTYGKSWGGSYPDTRCTATYFNGKIFVTSGQGELVCINNQGKKVWSVDYISLFESKAPPYGISESPLIVGNTVVVSPFGKKASLVAFNTTNGKVVWQAKSVEDIPQYVNAKLIQHNGRKIIVTLSENNIVAVDSGSGNILWKFYYADYFSKETVGFTNHAITPVYKDGFLFITSGWNYTALKFKLTQEGMISGIVWKSTDLDPNLGGVVLIDDCLFGSTFESNSQRFWTCLDWETGKTMWKKEWHNIGSIIAADNMLYFYDERTGYLGLVNPDPRGLDVISEFRITKGTGPHWAHPVICNGRLYIRHGKSILVYSVRRNV